VQSDLGHQTLNAKQEAQSAIRRRTTSSSKKRADQQLETGERAAGRQCIQAGNLKIEKENQCRLSADTAVTPRPKPFSYLPTSWLAPSFSVSVFVGLFERAREGFLCEFVPFQKFVHLANFFGKEAEEEERKERPLRKLERKERKRTLKESGKKQRNKIKEKKEKN
jgi:hypothetical protein